MQKSKIKKILLICLMLIEGVSIFLAYQSYMIKPKESKIIRNNKSYAIMLEDKDHLGTYNEYPENTWPGVGYILNIEMSSCVDSAGKEMEGLLTFDNEERIATVKSKKETYCYLYFKYDPAPVEISGFSITPVKTNNGKKYTNLERNKATLDWTDDDIQYYCLTESEEKPKIACDGKWTKSNGVKHIEVDYIFDNKTNEDKKVYAYTKDFGGSPSPRKDELINYDTIGPTIIPTPNGTKNSDTNSWYKTMNITLTGDDGVGIGTQNIKYCITTEGSCTPDKTINGGSCIVSLPTDSKTQKICYQGEDLLGQKGAANTCMNTIYQVDGSEPTLTVRELSSDRGLGEWVRRVSIYSTSSDTGSGVKSLKYCIAKDGTQCTPNIEEETSSKTIFLGNNTDYDEEQMLCAEVIDNAGNSSGVKCSKKYKVDGIPPSCGGIRKAKGVGTVDGVSGYVMCNDGISGCLSRLSYFSNLKSTTDVEIRDIAGNVRKCSVNITSKIQKRTRSCNGRSDCHSKWNCTETCTIYHCVHNLADAVGWDTDCVQSNPYPGGYCGPKSTVCTDGYYNYWSGDDCPCTSKTDWSAWSDVDNCSEGEYTECQTLYS